MRSNAKVWFSGKARLITLLAIGLLLVMSLVVSRWFQSSYVGWLIESVDSPNVLHAQWQAALDELPQLKHPVVIHALPSDCLCTLLTLKHAKAVSAKAQGAGFSILQLGSNHAGLGEFIEMDVPELSPLVAMTDEQGVLKYLGAYSDGVRCTTANSLVDRFIGDTSNLPSHTIIGLDVKVCRCDRNL